MQYIFTEIDYYATQQV